MTQAIKSSSFTLRDRIEFYKRKWLKDHVAIMVFLGICILGVAVAGCFLKNAWIGYGAFLLLIIAHCWRNNAGMKEAGKMQKEAKKRS